MFKLFLYPVVGGSAGSVNKTSTSLVTTSLSATVEARRKSSGSEFFFLQCTGTEEGDKRDWHTQTYKRKQASDQQILYGNHQIVCLM